MVTHTAKRQLSIRLLLKQPSDQACCSIQRKGLNRTHIFVYQLSLPNFIFVWKMRIKCFVYFRKLSTSLLSICLKNWSPIIIKKCPAVGWIVWEITNSPIKTKIFFERKFFFEISFSQGSSESFSTFISFRSSVAKLDENKMSIKWKKESRHLLSKQPPIRRSNLWTISLSTTYGKLE